MSEPQQHLPLGLVIADKWRIEAVLGAGGMGTVYRARHVRNDRSVALKVLHPALSMDREARERFLREGYAANHVGHAGTVQVLDDGSAPEGAFLVMDYLEGLPIDKLAEAHREVLPLGVVLAVAEAALEVLAVAHAKGIIHRDLKPENLFLTHQGQLKVLDFGLARVRESASAARLTTTGVPMGTPAFMPPEQALAHWDEVDTRSDVFSVGASMWTLLTGRLVHDATSSAELLVKAATKQVVGIASVCPQVPSGVAEVIDRALAFDASRRFANAAEMNAALRLAVRTARLTVPSLSSVAAGGAPMDPTAIGAAPKFVPNASVAPITSDSESGRRKGRATLLVSLAVASAVGVLGGALVYWRHGAPDAQLPISSHADSVDSAGLVEPLVNPEASSRPADASASASASASATPASAGASSQTSSTVSGVPVVVTARPAGRPPARPSAAPKPCDVFNEYGCKR